MTGEPSTFDREKFAAADSGLFDSLTDTQIASLFQDAGLLKGTFAQLLPRTGSGDLFVLLKGKVRLLCRSTQSEITVLTKETCGSAWIDMPIEASSIGSGSEPKLVVRTGADEVFVARIERRVVDEICRGNAEFNAAFCSFEIANRQLLLLRALNTWQQLRPKQLWELILACKCLRVAGAVEQSIPNGLTIVSRGGLVDSSGRKLLPGEFFVQHSFAGISGTSALEATEFTEILVLSDERYKEIATHDAKLAANLMSIISPAVTDAVSQSPAHRPGGNSADAKLPNNNVPSGDVPLPLPPVTRLRNKLQLYPYLMQQSQMDCGITCIAMIGAFYGKRLDINDLRARCGVSTEGSSMQALADTAEQVGFVTRGLKATYEGLIKSSLPSICFWRNNHFVVLYKIDKQHAVIADPAEGILTIPREDFVASFSHHALELTATTKLKLAPSAKSPISALLPLLHPYRAQVQDIMIAGLIFQVLSIVTPFFTQSIVDRVLVHEDVALLNLLLYGMLLVTGFQLAISFVRGILLTALSTKVSHQLFSEFFRKLFRLPLKFFEDRSTGDIIARFNENSRIGAFVSGASMTTLLDGSMAVIYVAVLFVYNWLFATTTLAYLCVLAALTVIYTPFINSYNRETFKRNSTNDSLILEALSGVEIIKAAAAENQIRWKWDLALVDKLNVLFRQGVFLDGYNTATEFVHLCGRILLMWVGAHLVISGKFTVGQYMAANMLASMTIDPLMRIISMWNQLQAVHVSVERLNDVMDAIPERLNSQALMPSTVTSLELRNVTFRYNEHAHANTLLNVSFSVRAGQMVALVGRSGCGKTTLARLVQGLYPATSGGIFVNGYDIQKLNLLDYRRQIGTVAQHEFFFKGTIRENISMYKPNATIEEVIAAALSVGIDSKIQSMSRGYDTVIEEGAKNFSGGERQRLALARVVLNKPAILIFDEATSALDTESERQVQQCMEGLRDGRIIFVIAHRLSTIKAAELILVMDNGQIVERGNHATLTAARGLYYNLCAGERGR